MKSIYLKITLLLFISFSPIFFLSTSAQRKMEKLDRGVVAVKNSAGNYFVSWRFLATDPESIQYNLYAKKSGASAFSKLNSTPLSLTNFSPVTGTVAAGTQLYVTTVVNSVESSPSKTFTIPTGGFAAYRSTFLDITYDPAKDGLDITKYKTKFCWPVDLDGDGEYDYVVDRRCTDDTNSSKVQAYLRDGTLLWTVDVGPNVFIDQGQDDMVIAYDMDGDGKGDVVIKSSDGTKFANGKGVLGSTSLDTDNDGIIDYNSQNVKNPPQYITVIDGLTGNEKNSIEMKYPSNYTRTNKSIFMGTEYSNLNGHMAIMYIDGKHPSVGFIYKTRTISDQWHWYCASAYGYNKSGQWVNWYNWERGTTDLSVGHQLRVADVDFDGRDELLDIDYGIKYDGTAMFTAHIGHGDRLRVGDFDPTRPGLETYAIQQYAGDNLGQLLYNSATGEAIKKFYLSSAGDVGRGECMDVDSTHLGYEFWSTMPNMYDAKGNVIAEGDMPFPYEGVWWDGDLAREELQSPDGNGYNADLRKYNPSTHTFSRLIEFAKLTNYTVKSEDGVRPAFFGDIMGDWREEVILRKKGWVQDTIETCTGIVGFSTDYPTSKRIYCLMQNPAYRMQATTRGYYEAANTDYYLGYNMPTPPIPPIQSAKLTWVSGSTFDKSTSNFVLQDEKTTSAFNDGDDVMFDISGDNSNAIKINTDLAPLKIWAMNPAGKDYVLSADAGKLTGTMEFVKSMCGKFTLNGIHTYTGKTTVSEGTLCLNGISNSPIQIQAKGALTGNAILNGGISVQSGLNIEGGKLAPGNGLLAGSLGKITINGSLVLPGNNNLEFDIIPTDSYKNDSLVINGDFTLSNSNTIIINGSLTPGNYSLITWTGKFTGSIDSLNVTGVTGLPIKLVLAGNTIQLVVEATRSASEVAWTGETDNNWNYNTTNFLTLTVPHESTRFVQNDSVVFDDRAIQTSIQVDAPMIVNGVSFANTSKSLIFTGSGGIQGSGNLVKTGKALLDLGNLQNTYTGKTIFNNALVKASSLNEVATAGVLGQSAVTPDYWTMNNSRLIVDAVTCGTDKGMTISGNDTIEISKSTGVVTMKGIIAGTGNFIKTGAGQLNLSGAVANTFSGETHIEGGIVALGSLAMNSNAFGTSGKIWLTNGAKLMMLDNSSDYNQKPTWYITVPENQIVTLAASTRCAISGTISGAGSLIYAIPAGASRAELSAGGGSAFTGTLNVTGSGSSFRITNNTLMFPSAKIYLGDNVTMGAYSAIAGSADATKIVKIGSLTGEATSTVIAGIWQIGSDNRDAIFNGTFGTGATVTKSGTGKWTLTNASTCTAAFTVSDGTLLVKNTTGSATGTGNVSFSGSSVLAGTGTISGKVTMSNTSTLAPGLSSTNIGTLTLGNNLILTSGTTTAMKVNATTNDLVKVTGTLTLNGTLNLSNLAGSWTSGKSYTLFSAATISGTFTSIVPATPGTNLVWDTSKLSQGIISIANQTAVDEISSAALKLYPQPVKDYCFIHIDNEQGDASIEVYGMNGMKELQMTNVNTGVPVKLDLSALKSGLYILRVKTAMTVFKSKIIKE